MKVILRQEVDKLGSMGEVVSVKNGYARNYLIPRQFAYVATPGAMKALEVEKKQYAKKLATEKTAAELLATHISELQISVPMKVGEEGRLYGSVTSQMISDEMELRGFTIDKRNIIIDESIKSLGVFDVKVKLHPEVSTILKIWVINQE
ncbi:MAG: 50S ribosomal protein L9 [FCB group bacterium]|jgi:large subunit ribosomal protein L9